MQRFGLISIGVVLGCSMLSDVAAAQQRLSGQLQIADPNIMRGLEGFSIKAFGFADPTHERTSQVKEAVSDAEGNFRIEVTPHGVMVAAFSPDHSVLGWSWVKPDQNRVSIPLVRSATLQGQFVDGASGRPIVALQIRTVTPVEKGRLYRTSFGVQAETDSSGRFTLRGFLPGVPYWVQVGDRIAMDDRAISPRFTNWIPVIFEGSETWSLSKREVDVNDGQEVGLRTAVSSPSNVNFLDFGSNAKLQFERTLSRARERKTPVLLYFRGTDTGMVKELDPVIEKVTSLFGSRLGLLVLDQAQEGSQELIRDLRKVDARSTWFAVLNSKGVVTASIDAAQIRTPAMFEPNQGSSFLKSPPTANGFLYLLKKSIPDLSLEEARTVVKSLGYLHLPGLNDF